MSPAAYVEKVIADAAARRTELVQQILGDDAIRGVLRERFPEVAEELDGVEEVLRRLGQPTEAVPPQAIPTPTEEPPPPTPAPQTERPAGLAPPKKLTGDYADDIVRYVEKHGVTTPATLRRKCKIPESVWQDAIGMARDRLRIERVEGGGVAYAPLVEKPKAERAADPRSKMPERIAAVEAYLREHGETPYADLPGAVDIPKGTFSSVVAEMGDKLSRRTIQEGKATRSFLSLAESSAPPKAAPGSTAGRRGVAAHTDDEVEAAGRDLGCFTITRLEGEKFDGAFLAPYVKRLTAAGKFVRHGGARGPSVFYTHRDYQGEMSPKVARGGRELRDTATPEPEPEATAPEGVPPHLADMPSLRAVDPAAPPANLRQLVGAAEGQYAVKEYVDSHDTAVASEIAAALDNIEQHRVGVYLRLLWEAGLIRRTNRNRLAVGQSRGRAGVEYASLGGPRDRERDDKEADQPAPPAPAPAPEAERPSEPAGPPSSGEPTAAQVRDAMRAEGEVLVSPGPLAEAHEWERPAVLARMEELAEQGIIEDHSLADMPVFKWTRPTGAGRAAELDAEARAADADDNGTANTFSGGGPSGKSQTPANPEVRKLVTDARAAGCTAQVAGNGHWEIKTPEGKRVLVSGTPRSGRSVMNDRSRLRRHGVKV